MISIAKQKDLPLHLGYFCIKDATITLLPEAFNELNTLGAQLQNTYKDIPISQIPGIKLSRDLFHDLGIDPTRRRPSSESLLRRALNGKGFFSVNSCVDSANWCSLDILLPVCVYDLATIHSPISVILGNSTHQYEAINHRLMQFSSKPLLADCTGAFGSPLTDSLRSAVTTRTRDVLFCLWAPHSVAHDTIETKLDLCAHRMQNITKGKLVSGYSVL